MTNIEQIFSTMEGIHKDCGSLMQAAEILEKSADPKQRVLAYEIGVSVSKITAEQKKILAELNEIVHEIGGMAE